MSKTTPLVNGRVYQVKGSPDAVIKQAMDDAYAPSISTVDSAKYSTMSSDSYQSAILPQPCVITDRRVPRRLAHVADLHRACLMMQIKGDPSTISPAKKHWLVPIDTEPPSSPTPATSIPPTSTSDHPPIQFTPAWPTPNEYVLAVPHKPQNTITPRPGLEHSLSEEERMRLLDICQEKSDTWPEEYKRIKKEKKQAGSLPRKKPDASKGAIARSIPSIGSSASSFGPVTSIPEEPVSSIVPLDSETQIADVSLEPNTYTLTLPTRDDSSSVTSGQSNKTPLSKFLKKANPF